MPTILKPQYGTRLSRSNPILQGMVGAWALNEGGVTAYDSVTGAAGTLKTSATFSSTAPGRFGAQFSGTNSSDQNYIDLGSRTDLNPANAISVFCVFWPKSGTGSATWQTIFAHGGPFTSVQAWALLMNGNDLRFYAKGSFATITTGKDKRICCLATYDRANVRLFTQVNNGAISTNSTSQTAAMDSLTAYNTVFGRGSASAKPYASDDAFGGRIECGIIWNRALGIGEFARLAADPWLPWRHKRRSFARAAGGGGGGGVFNPYYYRLLAGSGA